PYWLNNNIGFNGLPDQNKDPVEVTMKRSSRETEAISGSDAKKTGCRSHVVLILFSVPFFLAGAAVIYFLGVSPALSVLRASSWDPIPCVITSSKVASSSDGAIFAIEIKYSYTFDGKQYPGIVTS